MEDFIKPEDLTLNIREKDRVAVVHDGKVKKGKVIQTVADFLIMVKLPEVEEPITYKTEEAMLLYRYIDTPIGRLTLPLVGHFLK